MFNKITSFVCALTILAMPTAVSAAPAFQDSSNKPTFQQIPYAPELLDSLKLVQGLNTSNASLPTGMTQTGNLIYSMNQATAGQYNIFYANAWSNTTTPSSTSSGFFRVTVRHYMQITGSNGFSGESYNSGRVLLSSKSGWNFLAIVAVITFPVLAPFLGVVAGAGASGVAAIGGIVNAGGGGSSYTNTYSGVGSMLAFG